MPRSGIELLVYPAVDDGYRWLTDDLVFYQGTFDERGGKAVWSFYASQHLVSAANSARKALSRNESVGTPAFITKRVTMMPVFRLLSDCNPAVSQTEHP